MKILHVLKTSSGGDWAARQVTELTRRGVEVHVIVPSSHGSTMELWKNSGAQMHFANLDFPVRAPWKLWKRLKTARALVAQIQPQIIHSHFVGTTLTLRLALGKKHPIPRFFQVPGPLHMENSFFRRMEIATAGPADFWLASSRYIQGLYLKAGISADRVFQSYYGLDLEKIASRGSSHLRQNLGLPENTKIITNVSHMYPPKYYLGQMTGLKCHEDFIDALTIVTKTRPDVVGVLVGGAWGAAQAYEKRLRAKAFRQAGDRIHFMGNRPALEIPGIWADSDLAVHVPRSENCGGVVEPLLAAVPVIASRVGGIPEVIIENQTGSLVSSRNPAELAAKIIQTLDQLPQAKVQAQKGQALVRELFEIRPIVEDLLKIYQQRMTAPRFPTAEVKP